MDNPPLKLDTLVELADQYSNVYPMSPTGARGWVRARRELPKIDPEVYIEWDKGHWRYHGEEDGWTYEHHFRPVDDSALDDPLDPAPSMNHILDEARLKVEAERCPDCGQLHDTEEDDFLNTLAQAQEEALKSDGYIILTVTPEPHGELMIYEPRIHSQALSTAAQKILRTQLIYLAAQLYEGHILDEIQGLEGGPDELGR